MAEDDSIAGDISVAHDFFNSHFDSKRYKTPRVGRRLQKEVRNFVDGSDYLANKRKMMISFQHVPSGRSIFFKSFITAFNETYNSDWVDEKVYGRADPIILFKNTSRRITLAFKIPAGSESEAYENLTKIQQLAQFLYPNYKNVGDAETIAQSPLIRLKVMNLAQKSNPNTGRVAVENTTMTNSVRQSKGPEQHVRDYRSNHQSSGGLLGAITNLTIQHNLEGEDGAFMKAENTILPKLFEINLEFSVIHEQPLGWQKTRRGADFFDENFPYNAIASDPFSTFADGKKDVQSIIDAANPPQARIDNAKARKNKAIWGLSASEKTAMSNRRSSRQAARAMKKANALGDAVQGIGSDFDLSTGALLDYGPSTGPLTPLDGETAPDEYYGFDDIG